MDGSPCRLGRAVLRDPTRSLQNVGSRKTARPNLQSAPGTREISLAPDEGEDFFRKFIRLLLVGKMAGAVDGLEARAGNSGAIGAAVVLTENAIIHSPQKQRRNADTMQPSLELWIMHVGRPGVTGDRLAIAGRAAHLILRHRLVVPLADVGIAVSDLEKIGFSYGEDVRNVALLAAAHLDAHGIGQNEMGNPGGGFDRDLGRDPPAKRDTRDDNALEIELIEEIEVEIGEVVDGVERFRRLRSAETRMRRSDQAHARREPGEDGSAGLDADAGMEKQERRSFSALDHLNADAANTECLYHQLAPSRSGRRALYADGTQRYLAQGTPPTRASIVAK